MSYQDISVLLCALNTCYIPVCEMYFLRDRLSISTLKHPSIRARSVFWVICKMYALVRNALESGHNGFSLQGTLMRRHERHGILRLQILLPYLMHDRSTLGLPTARQHRKLRHIAQVDSTCFKPADKSSCAAF